MTQRTTIINVSNRLPVTVGEIIKKSSGGLVAALEGVDKSAYDLRWLGWAGTEVPTDQQAALSQRLEKEFGCIPVFISNQDAEGHYEGFSNSSLWPLLHYMPSRFRYEEHWWDAYRHVNEVFADAVLEQASDGDMVWVHDYQLMLLPEILKRRRPSLKIGFFLHTPFPSYEVFRCHPRREVLLAGLLGADLIGFHTFGYLRHFRSAAMRVLGVESDISTIRHNHDLSRLGVYPIGINAPAFAKTMQTEDYRQHLDRFRQNFAGKRIVLSVERLDYTKGLPQRLEAIDLFLAESDEQTRDHTKFIFVAIPSRENVEQYQILREDIESRIGRLNGKYTTLNNSPIHFIHGSVAFAELCALYAMAEVSLVTPLVDGMNMVAKEYVACQRDEPGVLVLSEFAGAAQELFSALIVNPYDTRSVADALREALAMPKAQRRERMSAMAERVTTMDAGAWARTFIDDLAARPNAHSPTADGAELIPKLVEALKAGRRLALFLDYDGTLREIENVPQAATPTKPLLDLLHRLRERPNIDVTVISGRSREDISHFLSSFTTFGFVAEHGGWTRAPGDTEWIDRAAGLDLSWKEEVTKILKLHAASTPGSHVEEKRTSLVWHYRRADPEFGGWKAMQLLSDLENALANQALHVRMGKKIVEVTPTQINKGSAVIDILTAHPADLVLAVGDDTTDESMFRLHRDDLLTLKIGSGDTSAAYVLQSPAALRRFLNAVLDQTV
ncbi:MAG TPA: bifunctional alpha,alpha-trehalose-phosphate synthase (UDP-forming)/trehalose-phosphatase [Tepidisphaeraceae bacterium]|jgi:trehalose 6-phosphate synthase/phosphatase